MTKVALLTVEEKELLIGQQYQPDVLFNPIQDVNNNWVISIQEVEESYKPQYNWLLDLPLINYVPKPPPFVI